MSGLSWAVLTCPQAWYTAPTIPFPSIKEAEYLPPLSQGLNHKGYLRCQLSENRHSESSARRPEPQKMEHRPLGRSSCPGAKGH